MFYHQNSHFKSLRTSYDEVGNKTWDEKDFNKLSLLSSRELFIDESLINREPITKDLEVYALVSGISFEDKFTNALKEIQNQVDLVIGDSLRYWVLPKNLAVEYCVFKWPDEVWNKSWNESIVNKIKSIKHESFIFNIYGIQVNQDGCIIANGYDEGGTLFKIREYMKNELSFIPKRQSGWAHVPLGRILEPIGESNFVKLKNLLNVLKDINLASCEVDSLKFVYEEQWYMEKKNILCNHKLLHSKTKR